MEIISPIIFGLIGLGVPTLIIAGIIYFIFKLRGGSSIRLDFRSVIRGYFYIVILGSIGLTGLGGLSNLIQVGLGETFGNDFSYGHMVDGEHWNDQEIISFYEREKKEIIIDGVSLTIIGAIISAIHIFGRRRIETEEEKGAILNRIYLITALSVFALATIVALVEGVPETMRYVILNDPEDPSSPGEPLAIAVVALPIWLYYLRRTLRAIPN